MRRPLHLEVPEPVYQSLAERAKAAGESLEAFTSHWLAKTVQQAPEDPIEPFIGAFTSPLPDWADEHDRYLGKNLMRETNVTERENSSDA